MIIGILSSCLRNGTTTQNSKRKVQQQREKSRSSFYIMSRCVCRKAFLFLLNNMNRKRLDRLSKHYKKDPTAPPTLKSGGRKNNTATLTLQDTQQVVQFIRNYAEEHAISLPGRVPGFKRDDILLLPSAHVKSSIYRRYKQSAEQAGRRKVGASTFRKLWATLCPFIVVAKIMTDLCWRSLAEDWDHKDIVNMPQFMQLGQMPPQIPAPGLSHERQTYLHKSIREFVRVDVRDRVCPPPV
ncbi:hypothetical protein ACOMHN_001458 [Nucella lapillus]